MYENVCRWYSLNLMMSLNIMIVILFFIEEQPACDSNNGGVAAQIVNEPAPTTENTSAIQGVGQPNFDIEIEEHKRDRCQAVRSNHNYNER